MSLIDRLQKTNKADTLDKSKHFSKSQLMPTKVFTLNGALSGYLRKGGLSSGMTGFGGHSRHFKSNLMLACARAFLENSGPDALIIFFDNEFGITPKYLEQMGIDPTRVLHVPVESVEQLRHVFKKYLDEITREDEVMFMLDSLGNAASSKEIKDAKEGNETADMTRAKVIKSLFRVVNVPIAMKSIPFVFVNHIYDTMETYSKPVFSGGSGPMLNCDTVIIVGRRKKKEKINGKDEHVGYTFVLNIEKSRFVREGTKLDFDADFEKGIDIYGGLLDIALATGHVFKPKNGWFQRTHLESTDKSWRRAETSCEEFWNPVFEDTDFEEVVHDKLMIGGQRGGMFGDDDEGVAKAKIVDDDMTESSTSTANRLRKKKVDDENDTE